MPLNASAVVLPCVNTGLQCEGVSWKWVICSCWFGAMILTLKSFINFISTLLGRRSGEPHRFSFSIMTLNSSPSDMELSLLPLLPNFSPRCWLFGFGLFYWLGFRCFTTLVLLVFGFSFLGHLSIHFPSLFSLRLGTPLSVYNEVLGDWGVLVKPFLQEELARCQNSGNRAGKSREGLTKLKVTLRGICAPWGVRAPGWHALRQMLNGVFLRVPVRAWWMTAIVEYRIKDRVLCFMKAHWRVDKVLKNGFWVVSNKYLWMMER